MRSPTGSARARRRKRVRFGPVPDEHQARPRDRADDQLEGGQDPFHALLAVQPAHVEQHAVIGREPQLATGAGGVAGREVREVHARRHDRDRRAHAARRELVADQRGRRDDGVGARGEARADADRGRLDETARQRDVVRVLVVARVVGEHEGAALAVREPARERAEEERMVRVEDVEPLGAHALGHRARPRHRQRELGIGRGRERGIAHDVVGRVGGAGKARREHPGRVTAGLESPAERLHRGGDAAAKRQVVVGEESDLHDRAVVTPC